MRDQLDRETVLTNTVAKRPDISRICDSALSRARELEQSDPLEMLLLDPTTLDPAPGLCQAALPPPDARPRSQGISLEGII
ncbi:MAG: hypothetical protein ABW321_18550 [Polyangiales bacterium]